MSIEKSETIRVGISPSNSMTNENVTTRTEKIVAKLLELRAPNEKNVSRI